MTLQAPWERKLPTELGIYPAVLYPSIYPLKFVYRTGRQVQRVFYTGISWTAHWMFLVMAIRKAR